MRDDETRRRATRARRPSTATPPSSASTSRFSTAKTVWVTAVRLLKVTAYFPTKVTAYFPTTDFDSDEVSDEESDCSSSRARVVAGRDGGARDCHRGTTRARTRVSRRSPGVVRRDARVARRVGVSRRVSFLGVSRRVSFLGLFVVAARFPLVVRAEPLLGSGDPAAAAEGTSKTGPNQPNEGIGARHAVVAGPFVLAALGPGAWVGDLGVAPPEKPEKKIKLRGFHTTARGR